ncbi:MAG: LysR family transcriptional regulator [Treponema sp.]|jgi:DNA-binding transcriptional LysR family regulator|nr:LysR family transcriptional regulator [Treponema sp.]
MNSINFDYYKAFYYTAKYGTVSRAAEELYITQPSLTKRLHKLEEQLNCVLFKRTQKGVNLTEEGNVLYGKIAPACETFLGGEDTLKKMINLESGIVKISSTKLMIKDIIIPAIKDFKKKYEKIQFELYTEKFRKNKNLFAA